MSRIYRANEVVAAFSDDPGSRNPTGFTWLDESLEGGPLTDDLVVVGAESGVGKSRFCVSSLVYRALLKQTSLYISLEDGKKKVGRRIAEAAHSIPEVEHYGRFAFHPVSTEDACQTITDCPEATMVFIDYIQDMGELDNKIIAKNLRALKEACRDISAVCVVTSQLTARTDGEGKMPSEPSVSWLRGAKELRQKADVILMLWANEDGTVNALVGKDKDRQAGTKALFTPEYGGNLLGRGKRILW